jgi:hypothetical protein
MVTLEIPRHAILQFSRIWLGGGQIERVVDGPSAMNNAIAMEAARTRSIASLVASCAVAALYRACQLPGVSSIALAPCIA